ncbi:LOW QUALITY PROTEIN: vascular non-inflammatory molecule 3 [Vulpes lagopus]|uniref:LOW QUALITY PROTEIN: vascular non-inflammatory molecule 3 n=1 Tax=Vulpes lagopus TaxID=494514 RepID=UPI001BCA3F7F|nr:LOW QUALITY PROTEIN: vascular non-inflammatory molecule 3 [Vulpes lagopus]
MKSESGQLMLSELKSQPRREPTYPVVVDWSAYASSVKPSLSEQSNFLGMLYFDELSFIELKRNTGNYAVCQKDLCGHLTYKMSEKRTDQVYALGAFDVLHTVEYQYYIQVSRDGSLRSESRASLPVLVMALYGRVFEKDPLHLG